MAGTLLQYIIDKKHHGFRKKCGLQLAEEYKRRELCANERMTDRFEKLTGLETPVFLPNENICFVRTICNLPEIYTEAEWEEIKAKHFIHELGYVSNLSPDYEGVIKVGLLEKRMSANAYSKRVIDSIISLSDRYKNEALRQGRDEIAKVLERVPRYGATNLKEALQFFRIIHFSLWLEGNYHNTIGRFDQYMYPYFKEDMEKGVYNEETVLELIEDFFLSFNKDSDLYPGVQQGDNGQSLVLGGVDESGKETFNLLSRLCLKASENLCLIDPKINLRVNKNTPLEIYELGSRLTKAGLGFPQYSNDDVVIKGLVSKGYDYNDAVNYTVAACWEFIIPGVGADVTNIAALSFPKIIDQCLHRSLHASHTFSEFMRVVERKIREECDGICDSLKDVWFIPSPFMEMISKKQKYKNFGIHGTGITTAVDSLSAIKKHVFEEKTISKEALIEAVDSDFQNHSELLPILRFHSPKMGNDDDFADEIAVALLDVFADCLEGRENSLGGIFRAGTGSAMYYLWHADEIGASPDGRRKGEAFGANYSPSLFAKTNGPISVIKSFSKPHLERVINGGPLTLEFHSSVFSDEDSVKKVAMLVKSFIHMGGHQLQLNAVNVEKLRAAQKSPEDYRQLVVRIWGWSAYFVELDRKFQEHVIARQEFLL